MASTRTHGVHRALGALLAAAAVALLALIASGTGAAQTATPGKPTAVAFVVGVENFDMGSLNTLNYVASDAVQVFHAIRAVTNLDAKSSQILLATTKGVDDIQGLREVPSTTLKKKEKLTKDEIEDGLESFLNKAKDLPPETLLFIYFGGHGDAESQDQSMSYLASNFQKEGRNFRYHWRLDSIIRLINSKIGGDRATIMFMNACHASGESSEKRETVKELFANKRRYFYPASVSAEKTFEDKDALKGSFFVRALTDALYGGAADTDGAITTFALNTAVQSNLGLLYEKHVKGIKLSLPQAELAAPMKIGAVSDVQSEEKGMLGIALATAAAQLETRAPQSVRSTVRSRQHARMLYRLAAMNFHRAAQLTEKEEIKAEWYFAEASSRVQNFLARPILPLEVGSILPDEISAQVRDPVGAALRHAVKNLKSPSAQYEPLAERAKAALEIFDREVRYVNLLLTEQPPKPRPGEPVRSALQTGADKHKGLLEILADNARGKPLNEEPFEFAVAENVVELSADLKASLESFSDPQTVLNVIYSGASVKRSPQEPGLQEGARQSAAGSGARGQTEDLSPVSSVLLWSIARLWRGPVNILFDADYGGVIRQKLLELPNEVKDRVSLLLTAGQEDGRRNEGTTYDALKQALKNGLNTEKLNEVTLLHQRLDKGDSRDGSAERPVRTDQRRAVPGRAEWFGVRRRPFVNEFPELRQKLSLGRQLDWWAYYWGARGVRLPIIDTLTMTSPAEHLKKAEEEVWRPAQDVFWRFDDAGRRPRWRIAAELIEREANSQVFRRTGALGFWCTMAAFRRGLLQELSSDRADPFERNFADLCGVLGPISREHFVAREDGVAPLRRAVWDVKQTASTRFEELGKYLQELSQGKQAMGGERPKVHLISLSAGEYTSPNIPRLERVDADMLAWRETLMKRLQGRLEIHELPAPGPNETIADTVRGTLNKVAEASKEHDLILFLYSGRGATLADGDAVLVPADVSARIDWPVRTSPFFYLSPSSPEGLKTGTPNHTLCAASPAEIRACLKINDIAQITKDKKRSLVAIFDTQFEPVPGQLASLIDRYVFPATQSNTDQEKTFPFGANRPYRKAANYPQALMIWFEGRVPNLSSRLAKVNLSTGMLIDAFEDADLNTYQDFLNYLAEYPDKKARRVFGSDARISEIIEWFELVNKVRESMRPAILGEVKRPLFAGGFDIDKLVRLAVQEDRSDLNIEIGAELARAHRNTAKDNPLVALTTVAALATYADAIKADNREKARDLYGEASDILTSIKEDQIYASTEGPFLYIDYLYWAAHVNGDEDIGNLDDALRLLTTGRDKDRMSAEIGALYGHFIADLTKKAAGRSAEKIDQGKRLLANLHAHYSKFGRPGNRSILEMLADNIRALEKEADNYKKSQKAEDRYHPILDPEREPPPTVSARSLR